MRFPDDVQLLIKYAGAQEWCPVCRAMLDYSMHDDRGSHLRTCELVKAAVRLKNQPALEHIIDLAWDAALDENREHVQAVPIPTHWVEAQARTQARTQSLVTILAKTVVTASGRKFLENVDPEEFE